MKYDSQKTIDFGSTDEKKNDTNKKKKKVIFKEGEEKSVENKKETKTENN